MNKIMCLLSNNTSTELSLSNFKMTLGKVITSSKKIYPCSFVSLFECRSGSLLSNSLISGMVTYSIQSSDPEENTKVTTLNIPFILEDRGGNLFLNIDPQIVGSSKFRCESIFTSSEHNYSEVFLNLTNNDNYNE